MEHWTIAFVFVSINLQHIIQWSQALQPPGYIGCYPNSIADLIDKTLTQSNNGTYCIGVCKSHGYRYAATQGFSCKCARVTNVSVYGNDVRCTFHCPSGETEYCGGENGVSLYDTLSPETYQECVAQESLGLEALTAVINDNSATRCAFYCEEWHYTFSGTKNNFCICVDRLILGYNISTKCKAKCPGDEEETCGGEGSVSVRRAGYVKKPIKSPNVSRLETSSKVNITRLARANVTDESTRNTSSVLLTTQASNTIVSLNTDTKVNATIESPLTAVYIWLPVGITVAASVVLIMRLLLRRYKRTRSGASVRQRVDSSCQFKLEQRENTMSDADIYQTIDPGISVERSTHRLRADDNCDAGYLTPVDSNDTAGYITPVDSNDTVQKLQDNV